MYIIPDYTWTVASFNMELNNEIIDCFTEKKEEKAPDIEYFKSDSMESYHKEDIIKINQHKLITHVNTQAKNINYYKLNEKGTKAKSVDRNRR